MSILDYGQGCFPIKYLGVPLFAGRVDTKIWEEVINKCQTKSTSWKNKWLTQAGRLQMIRSVLSIVPTYFMSCYRLSSRAATALDGMLKKFIREGHKEEKKIPLIHWDTTCLLKEDGGARLRKMSLQNLALGAKLAWKMYKYPHKGWCRLMANKYLDTNEPERIFTMANTTRGSSIWSLFGRVRK